MPVTLRELTADEFRAFADECVDIYGAAMQRGPEIIAQRRELVRSHLPRPGFVAVIAQQDGEGPVLGFGYAYRGQSGQWWHDVVAKALGDVAARWLGDSLEIVELHVLPAHQGAGTGRRLLDRLVELGRDRRTVVLSTHDMESPARALYRSTGFVDLLTGFRFPGGTEVFAVMGRERPA